MSGGAFRQAEIPAAVREIMKLSIEHAKQAFDDFVIANERTWAGFGLGGEADTANFRALNQKIAEIIRNNADAHFALALKLSEVKDMGHAIELQNEHAREQMENFSRQLEDVRDLAMRLIAEARPKA